jgi:uncharacterized protein (TIGR02284 family)
MQRTYKPVESLNSVLRGEMSAVETYRQAEAKLGPEPAGEEIRRIKREHRDAADRLWQQVERAGGEPPEDSGAWGAFAKATEGTAKLFGDGAAIKALKEGEEHGLKEYQQALEQGNLPAEAASLVRDQLIPQQREHIATLDRLLDRG